MSVDPLAEKYPSVSPYNYALNNPLAFLDPNGREVRGTKEHLDSLATEINAGLQGSGIDNASVSVQSKEVPKTGISLKVALFANQLGLKVSLTETVYFLQIEGEGFNRLAYGQITTGDDIKDEALNMLSDLLRSPTVFDAVIEPHDEHARTMHTGGGLLGNKLLLDPKSEASARGVSNYFGLIMHELVGHGHPDSPNSLQMMQQGSNIIGKAFGLTNFHDHTGLFNANKPRGGYNGYPVELLRRLPKLNR